MGWPFPAARIERRSLSFQDVFGRGGSADLIGSGPEAGLRLVPLYACTRLIADQFASAPLHGYRQLADGSAQRLNPQPKLALDPSGLGRTPFTWKYQAITSALLRGNATGLITSVDQAGWATAVEWLHPDKCSIDESDPWNPKFFYEGRRLNRDGIVHVPAYIIAGRWRGVSPVTAFRTLLETGQLAQESAHDWFANGMAPSGHLKNTGKTLTPEESTTAKERYKAAISNRDVLVTGNDWSFDTIAVAADEARFIETLKLTATQIASIYGVPPDMVGGERGSSMNYSTTEMDGINLLRFALRPWFERFEEALTRVCARPQYFRFNADSITRADLKTRMEAHDIALRTGLETQDEARRLEDKPPLSEQEQGDWLKFYVQKNQPPPKEGR